MNEVHISAASVQRKVFNQAKLGKITLNASFADLGKVVREGRERLGLTQAQLALHAGVGHRFIAELESGKETVRMDKVLQVCRDLNVILSASVSIIGSDRFDAYR